MKEEITKVYIWDKHEYANPKTGQLTDGKRVERNIVVNYLDEAGTKRSTLMRQSILLDFLRKLRT
jgi:hypothetical protein